jgi:hypothetical protein
MFHPGQNLAEYVNKKANFTQKNRHRDSGYGAGALSG